MAVLSAQAGLWRRAGLLRRLAAVCYDLLLVTALLMALAFVVIIARGGAEIDAGAIWFQCLLLLCWWLYFAWSWTHGGQTIGMRAWRLRIRSRDGQPVSWRATLLRFAGAAVAAACGGLGFLWCLIDRDGLAWHDRLSGTELRQEPKPTVREPAREP